MKLKNELKKLGVATCKDIKRQIYASLMLIWLGIVEFRYIYIEFAYNPNEELKSYLANRVYAYILIILGWILIFVFRWYNANKKQIKKVWKCLTT